MQDLASNLITALEGEQDEELRFLVPRFSRHMASEDVGSIGVPAIFGQVSLVRQLAARRLAGTSNVVLRRDDDGLATVAAIVTDDMPFLVDSVTAALTDEGRFIRLVMHPQLVVERDPQGNLLAILDLDVDDPRPEGAIAESWMCFRMDRDFTHESEPRIVERLERVLRDVRAAVDDWQPMVAQAMRIARELRAVPPVSVPDVEVRESADLLEWLCDDHLTFVGYREYRLVAGPDGAEALEAVADSGLGILRAEPRAEGMSDVPPPVSTSFSVLPPAVRAQARDPRVLVLTKANSRSTVHRSSYLDYIGVKVFDASGEVIGERRFLGLLTASAYNESVAEIPVLRELVHRVTDSLGLVPGSHSAKDLRQFLETYPRDELFQTRPEQLIEIAASVMHLLERRQTKLYLRVDDYGRFVSCIVYLPRDRYTTPVRLRIERLLRETFGGVSVDYTALVTESVLARLHYVVHVAPGATVPEVDHAVLEERLARATQSWEDLFTEAMVAALGEAQAPAFLAEYATAFPEGYKEEFRASVAVNDALTIDRLQPSELALDWYAHEGDDTDRMRFKVIRVGSAMSLSRILPTLQVMGVEVLDEHPHVIARSTGAPAWVLDFGLRLPPGDIEERDSLPSRATDAFRASWFGECETDAFNVLVVRAGLTWRQTSLIRAYSRYLRQVGFSFGQEYIQRVMTGDAGIVRLLVRLFETQFDPRRYPEDDARLEASADLVAQIERELEGVLSLDHDRIFRAFLAAIRATLRTNYFAQDRGPRQAFAFKIDPRAIPDMPLPKPMFEIWAYSPRVEGVHMRFGTVARGGLRWSDRSEDFRTEVLGLVKAQEVKNAVIVPVGAKGGFFARELPDPAVDREAWFTEGKASYREFVSALLDVTDNRVSGGIVAPRGVVRRDGDDSYLVVAADKGTATFSDLANEISAEYGFWLGDAFASGGSVGYDHKAMGITARGAWESVKRHFRDLGINTQAEDFTVVGVGDMSGDVFGNGMLLSEGIRLVAAFDHRDIFIDPDPDPAVSFGERARLFGLSRSSWADYDAALISRGGGVYSRSAKSIDLSPEALSALGLSSETGQLTPAEVMRAILVAPVDLLWNGGIGTYVKSRTQTNAEVGDKGNDAIRVNGDDLRCRVVGEGGNLGLTQLGRVEAARAGVRLNTDAIDNSAGVDTSDHEVNIKILLDEFVAADAMSLPDRNALLAEMTEVVGEQVLDDNYAQNVVLGNARAGSSDLITVHQRMIRELERQGLLDRALEFLPDDEELNARRVAGQGLTSPELAVLLAYAKISLTAALTAAGLGDDPWYEVMLRRYFPGALSGRFGDSLGRHPLRAEIISTVTCNRLLNIGGITFVFRAMEETGASALEVVKAATVAIEVFGIQRMWDDINGQDNLVASATQDALHLETRRLLDRATRWLIQTRGSDLDVAAQIRRFQPVVEEFAGRVPDVLRGGEADRLQRVRTRFLDLGAPEALAQQASAALDVFALLDIAEISGRTGEAPSTLIPLYFAISERYDVDQTLMRITALPRGDRWGALARQALRSDLYGVIAGLTARVSRATSPALDPSDRILEWEQAHAAGLGRARATLDEIAATEDADLATLSVALRVLRNLVAQGAASTLD